MFLGKKITLCVSGCLFADRMPEIISWLKANKADVQVALTESALDYLSSHVIEKLSGNAVAIDMFTLDDIWRAVHIDIAGCDAFILAPAERNILKRIAIGMADDLVTASFLATSAPVLIVPDPEIDLENDRDLENDIIGLSRLGYQFFFPDHNMADKPGNIIEDLKDKIAGFMVNKSS